jgi:hypothetical protein
LRPGDVVWIDPASINIRISPSADLSGNRAGDWDLERRRSFAETAKYKSMVEHFVHGVPWERTTLFAEPYMQRMAKEGHIGRYTTMAGVAEHYRKRFDPMFEAMKRSGFSTTAEDGRPYPLPTLLIGRDGEVFIGNNGNHRLALAKVIGLDKIAGRIVCRHKLARH